MISYQLRCTECSQCLQADALPTLCERCQRPLEVHYELSPNLPREQVIDASQQGMWRYRGVLPLPAEEEPVTLGEGGTPLLELPRLAKSLGVKNLQLKDEGINPTGSFKARGMSAAVTMARHFGATALAAPSAGNAGGALAAYGARAGIPVVLAMPEDVPLVNRLEAELCGAEVHLVAGTIADCGRWLKGQQAERGWFDLSTLKEPYRVEGKKTMGYELFEDLGGKLPDVIFYPTGGGTGLVGICKAFRELKELGWIDTHAPLPRMVAVQAEGCAPISDAWRLGTPDAQVPNDPFTVASGLRVPTPVGDRWVLRDVAASRGFATTVDDATLIAATRQLAREEGIFAAPEAGALVAALQASLARGSVTTEDHIVLLGTGIGLKYQECFQG